VIGLHVLPRQCHHLADDFFVRIRERDARAASPPPGSAFGRKNVRVITNEVLLLLRRELHHAVLWFGVNGCEDAIVHTEVRMTHVRAFDGL